MAFWLWGGGAAGALAVLLLLSRFVVRVRYSRSGRFDQLVVLVRGLYGLYRYRFVLPAISVEGPEIVISQMQSGGLAGGEDRSKGQFAVNRETYRTYVDAGKELLSAIGHFRGWMRRFVGRIECTRWRLDFTVGTGNAAYTAVVSGLLWTITGFAAAVVGKYVQLAASPSSRIKPNYDSPEFAVVWEADFRIRLGAVCWSFLALLGRVRHLRQALRAFRHLRTQPDPVEE